MTTIGSAVLQVIPSLRGVSEAIDKQIDGKVISVSVEPKVDKRAAEKAGKDLNDAVIKSTNDNRGGMGRAARTAAEEFGKGMLDGISGELKKSRGGLGDIIVSSANDGIKSGNLTGSIRDAVLPGISGIGSEIRSGATNWSSSIADALRSGDIQGATGSIRDAVLNTTDVISNIGSTFGLQLDGVRSFGEQAATTLSDVGGDVQGVVDTAVNLKSTFTGIGTVLETVLPGKAKAGASAITSALSGIAIPATLALALDEAARQAPNGSALNSIGRTALPFDPTLKKAGPDAPWYERDALTDGWNWLKEKGGFDAGGYTGNFPIDKITGVVHGDEQVIQSKSRRRIESDHPGLLDYMNKNGKLPGRSADILSALGLPGYEGGGLVDNAKQFATSLDPAKYLMGGFSPTAIDCSGFVSAVANVATGRPPFSSRMSTVTEGSWLKSLGFQSGRGKSGDLRVGWWDKGGGANGHTAGTFPDGTNFESNGSQGVVVGGKTGADSGQFTQHAFLPASLGSPNGGNSEAILTALGLGGGGSPGSSAAPEAATSSSTAAGSGSGGGANGYSLAPMPSSISGLSSWGLNGLGAGINPAKSGKDLSEFGNAAGAAVEGQVSSLLGVLGVPNSPGWLKGITDFAGGISVTDKATGKKVFGGGGSAASALGGIGSGFGNSGDYGGAAPVSASAPAGAAAPDTGTVHGGGGAPGPVTNYNIRTATVEDAWVQAQRRDDLRRAAKLDHH